MHAQLQRLHGIGLIEREQPAHPKCATQDAHVSHKGQCFYSCKRMPSCALMNSSQGYRGSGASKHMFLSSTTPSPAWLAGSSTSRTMSGHADNAGTRHRSCLGAVAHPEGPQASRNGNHQSIHQA
eukprot:1158556-Pelagomonas_calceolata.AAC.4